MDIKYSDRSPEDIRRDAVKERPLDLKSIILGCVVFLLIGVGASLWHFTQEENTQKVLKNFEFTPEDPDQEEFELKEPQRELLEEQVKDVPDEMEEFEEMPNIQMTTEITDTTIPREVIKTETIEVSTEIDIDITEMDIIDAPEEVVEIAEEVAYALTPIASVVAAPADLFKIKKPNPRTRPQRELLNKAPRASEGLKVSPRQFGDLDAPTLGELGPMSINLLGSGEFMHTMGRSGGMETRTAVDSALRWLALHQEPDGHWDDFKWNEEDCDFENPLGDDAPKAASHNTGVSSLAILAMMGGGQTIRKGEYRSNLVRAMEWLIGQQDAKTGKVSDNMYEHAIATIALCEAFGRSPDERLGEAARKAVNFCVYAAALDGGWRYSPRPATSDMSVTGWFLQALKTAKLAQIKFDHRAFSRGLTYVDQVTDQGGMAGSSGGVGYTHNAGLSYGAGSPPLTCAAMVVRQFSGMGVKAPLLIKGARLTQNRPPDWKTRDFYYWYYATYAMHNMGGEYRIWWNRRIRDVLLDNQSKQGHQAGSWNPGAGQWSTGRVFGTAMGALCLEVYYRYGEALQSFGTVPDLEDLFFQ